MTGHHAFCTVYRVTGRCNKFIQMNERFLIEWTWMIIVATTECLIGYSSEIVDISFYYYLFYLLSKKIAKRCVWLPWWSWMGLTCTTSWRKNFKRTKRCTYSSYSIITSGMDDEINIVKILGFVASHNFHHTLCVQDTAWLIGRHKQHYCILCRLIPTIHCKV